MTITLASLREQVRQRADMQYSEFIGDDELDLYINNSYFELFDVLVSRFEDYFLYVDPLTGQPPTFVLAGNEDTYDIPTNFYKLRGIDLLLDGNQDSWAVLAKWNFLERSALQNNYVINAWARPQPKYRVLGDKIWILPRPQAAGTYRLWYIPKCVALSTNADPDLQVDMIPYMEQWSDYVVVDAAIKCLAKEESDPTVYMMQKDQLLKRIEALASSRDAGQPERIADVNRGSYGTNCPGRGWGGSWG